MKFEVVQMNKYHWIRNRFLKTSCNTRLLYRKCAEQVMNKSDAIN